MLNKNLLICNQIRVPLFHELQNHYNSVLVLVKYTARQYISAKSSRTQCRLSYVHFIHTHRLHVILEQTPNLLSKQYLNQCGCGSEKVHLGTDTKYQLKCKRLALFLTDDVKQPHISKHFKLIPNPNTCRG